MQLYSFANGLNIPVISPEYPEFGGGGTQSNSAFLNEILDVLLLDSHLLYVVGLHGAMITYTS